MKPSIVITAACITSASAFAPQTSNARAGSALFAKKEEQKKSLFQTIFEMDLFAPVATQNDYGARKSKKLTTGKLSGSSYVPAGLTKAQYEAVRNKDSSKKEANYNKNVAKAGKFLDYTKFYLDRGTDVKQDWYGRVDGGHRMAKTKYDYSGTQGDEPEFGGVGVKGGKAKAGAKKGGRRKIAKK